MEKHPRILLFKGWYLTWFCCDASSAFIITKAAVAEGFPLQCSRVFNIENEGLGRSMKGVLFWLSIFVAGIATHSAGPVDIDNGGVVGI